MKIWPGIAMYIDVYNLWYPHQTITFEHAHGLSCVEISSQMKKKRSFCCCSLWESLDLSNNTILLYCSYSGLRNYEWDYRWMDYPYEARDLKHPSDQSIATYKGHSVLRTLIRCYFSPVYRWVLTYNLSTFFVMKVQKLFSDASPRVHWELLHLRCCRLHL